MPFGYQDSMDYVEARAEALCIRNNTCQIVNCMRLEHWAD